MYVSWPESSLGETIVSFTFFFLKNLGFMLKIQQEKTQTNDFFFVLKMCVTIFVRVSSAQEHSQKMHIVIDSLYVPTGLNYLTSVLSHIVNDEPFIKWSRKRHRVSNILSLVLGFNLYLFLLIETNHFILLNFFFIVEFLIESTIHQNYSINYYFFCG